MRGRIRFFHHQSFMFKLLQGIANGSQANAKVPGEAALNQAFSRLEPAVKNGFSQSGGNLTCHGHESHLCQTTI
jgi:hypothetical protein